jgi:hypothetical protein
VVSHPQDGLGRWVDDQSSPKGSDEHVVEGFHVFGGDLTVRLRVGQIDDHCSRFRQHGDVLLAGPRCGVARPVGLTEDPPEQAVVKVECRW